MKFFLEHTEEKDLKNGKIYLCKTELNDNYLFQIIKSKEWGEVIKYRTRNSFDGDPISPIEIFKNKIDIIEYYIITPINSIMQ